VDGLAFFYTWWKVAILKITTMSKLHPQWSNVDEIRQANAESYTDDGEMVEIGTGSRNPIWRPFVFINRK